MLYIPGRPPPGQGGGAPGGVAEMGFGDRTAQSLVDVLDIIFCSCSTRLLIVSLKLVKDFFVLLLPTF